MLARKPEINKAGFYWHFKDRADRLDQLTDYWMHEHTEIVAKNSILAAALPRDRLLVVMNMIYKNKLAELYIHFNGRALRDNIVENRV